MGATLIDHVSRVNLRFAELPEDARKALRGESNFEPQEIENIREPNNGMAPIIHESAELRTNNPEICPQLDLYASTLSEVQSTLDQFP